jgi:hypothetical protein
MTKKKKKPEAVDDAIERALAPYVPLFSAETLEVMREQMREYATTHPYPVALLRQLDAADVKESHVRSKNGAPEAGSTAARRAKS